MGLVDRRFASTLEEAVAKLAGKIETSSLVAAEIVLAMRGKTGSAASSFARGSFGNY